jgi:RNA polymerase sigma factor (sigma-70 family)
MHEGTRAETGPSGAAGTLEGVVIGVGANPAAVARTAAYAELYRERNQQLIAYATTLTGSPQAARDVVAEAHFRVWRRLRAGHEVENVPAYLTTTVRNLAAGLGRAQREIARDWRDLPQYAATVDGVAGAGGAGIAVGGGTSAAPDPAQRASQVELLTRLLKQIPERWASALWYAEVEDLPMETVGGRIGANASTAAVALTRARERLRQAFLQSQSGVPADERCADYRKQMPSLVRGTASARRTKRVTKHAGVCEDCHGRLLALTEADTRLPLILGPALLAGVLGDGAWLVPSISGFAHSAEVDSAEVDSAEVDSAEVDSAEVDSTGVGVRAGTVARTGAARTGSRTGKAGVARHARVKSGVLGHSRAHIFKKSISPARGVLVGSIAIVAVAAAATAFALGTAGPNHSTAAATVATVPGWASSAPGAATGNPAASVTATTAGTAASTTGLPSAASSGPAAAAASVPGATQDPQTPQQAAQPAGQTSQQEQATATAAQGQGQGQGEGQGQGQATPSQTPSSAPTSATASASTPAASASASASASSSASTGSSPTGTPTPTGSPTESPTSSPTTSPTESPTSSLTESPTASATDTTSDTPTATASTPALTTSPIG